MKKNKIVFIFGPTAVGKSDILFNFPKGIAEVINVDSIQVYKEFDIASCKPSVELRSHIKHHLVDFLEPIEEYNLGVFYKEASKIIKNLRDQDKLPVFVGGSAFYFKHLQYGLPSTPPVSSEIRFYVNSLFTTRGKDYLLEELKRVDFERYESISENDIYRIRRSLEVYYQTGIPISQFLKKGQMIEDVLAIGLKRPMEEMRSRIISRVGNMIDCGLLEEIKSLLGKGYDETTPAFKGIGYREFLLWKSRPYSMLNDIIDLIVKNSFLYVKRQMTFFDKIPNVLWFHPDDDLRDILDLIFV
ncbi:tRNA (adenosine(37)-N6)-dimethylallyltransferase MiaA [Borrelia turicatae]|uniref:tRNA dimethylallyltransferase n=1 Tax=Borrelia turicatae (strain 91E135) TaxID=314724 RepID=MIAA_BORT9|nr:tRNA (adenosine(37)-N6)-dimethylallyltransferase MiaA [Borrelia turicatae]A1R0P6.1 RecName: Full=tRNA dimethylallyltransferase; AltName: Full=Dimethylallyl diphosphate:tRNA dimethylallyltransferase; Short=DMAPP:tRNA dimethylallyltransferase; Short=DMATase; AltName: Full=Isopentenyl-diphosphate:tRNA isopentenyltransferase; Short=IPP transferase; Short=IPPT; Short=IPTase [Borrelia turicatae 91E135]AAX18137.1 tRNA delta(2)-isopentenylpyrophosphate transferase [Borrelia turicatae 91E135]UPA13634.